MTDRTPAAAHLDDEALVALIDGERGVAAGAERHLGGCAPCAARRDELLAARRAVADAPAGTVDELTRRRLLAGALAEAPAKGARPWYLRPALAGGVAAALLAVFAAVPFLLDGDGNGDGTSEVAASADAPSFELAAGVVFLGELGDVSDAATVRDHLDAAASTVTADAASRAAGEAGPPETESWDDPAITATPMPGRDEHLEIHPYQGGPAARLEPADPDETRARRCADLLYSEGAAGGPLVAFGLGRHHDVPVVVAAYSGPTGTDVFIVARDDCRVMVRYRA